MSYRYYRLAKTTATRMTASVKRIHRILKNLELTMNDFKFSGVDQILIFQLLSCLVEQVDITELDEGKRMVCFQHMLTKTAALEYR